MSTFIALPNTSSSPDIFKKFAINDLMPGSVSDIVVMAVSVSTRWYQRPVSLFLSYVAPVSLNPTCLKPRAVPSGIRWWKLARETPNSLGHINWLSTWSGYESRRWNTSSKCLRRYGSYHRDDQPDWLNLARSRRTEEPQWVSDSFP